MDTQELQNMELKQRLSHKQLDELGLILSLIDKYNACTDPEERNQLVRMIAVRHVITKGYLTGVLRGMLFEKDIESIEMINDRIWVILKPIYYGLTELALNHLEDWFISMQRRKGVVNPALYDYQKDLIRWLLRAIICHEKPETIYTLLVSRSSGKTYSLALVGFFLMLFHDRYIIHNNFGSYVEICSSPARDNLRSFIKYYLELCDMCSTKDDAIGLLGRTEKEDNELGLYIKYKSQDKIEIMRNSGGSFSMVFFALGNIGCEGLHCALHLADEGKFYEKKTLEVSLIPTVGNRVGVFCMLSSASEDYCYMQDRIEQNIVEDMIEVEEKGEKVSYVTWDGRPYDRNQIDNIKIFKGKTHYQAHYSTMIMENRGYALAVARALSGSGEEDPSFQTQYHNKFLSRKSSSFFDIKILRKNYKNMFEDENIDKYLDNPDYVIIAGWDKTI